MGISGLVLFTPIWSDLSDLVIRVTGRRMQIGYERIAIFEFRPISRFIAEMIQESRNYYGTPIGTTVQSIELCHLQ